MAARSESLRLKGRETAGSLLGALAWSADAQLTLSTATASIKIERHFIILLPEDVFSQSKYWARLEADRIKATSQPLL
jgi:hypothetical protein